MTLIAVAANRVDCEGLAESIGDSQVTYCDTLSLKILRECGLSPIILSEKSDIPAVAGSLTGIFLPGSHLNCHRSSYDAIESEFCDSLVDQNRDELDSALVSLAREKDIPLLALCRGFQTLNVARGGRLRKLPADSFHSLRIGESRADFVHSISLIDDSLLRNIYSNRDCIEINGCHSSQVIAPGEGLRVIATSSDGGIEAVEDPTLSFLLGLQFHPEIRFYQDCYARALLQAFANACKNYRA